MPDVLIFADSVTSPEMRHEVPVLVPDPFLYVEKDGKRYTASTSFEVERIAEAGIEAHAWEEFGYDELLAQGVPRGADRLASHQPERLPRSSASRTRSCPAPSRLTSPTTCARTGSRSRRTPSSSPTAAASKNEAELAGIRRAQKAAEAGMGAAKDMLARAEASNGSLSRSTASR